VNSSRATGKLSQKQLTEELRTYMLSISADLVAFDAVVPLRVGVYVLLGTYSS